MEYVLWILAGVVLVWFVFARRGGMAPEAQAQEWIKQGARVIDVRNPEEFAHRQIPGAINVPLSSLQDDIAKVAPNKNETLLLHCVAGGRSALGVRKLKKLGYTKAYNLGSYSRADRVVKSAQATPGGG